MVPGLLLDPNLRKGSTVQSSPEWVSFGVCKYYIHFKKKFNAIYQNNIKDFYLQVHIQIVIQTVQCYPNLLVTCMLSHFKTSKMLWINKGWHWSWLKHGTRESLQHSIDKQEISNQIQPKCRNKKNAPIIHRQATRLWFHCSLASALSMYWKYISNYIRS